MFTVKASYNGELRKFSFQANTFPSFEELSKQLSRVFPSNQNYFLSKLLFSPDASLAARILIGNEVHSAEDYSRCLVPFRGRSWSNALLRLSIVDEPFRHVSDVTTEDSASFQDNSPSARSIAVEQHPPVDPRSTNVSMSTRPISLYHVPPPPIVFPPVSHVYPEESTPSSSNSGADHASLRGNRSMDRTCCSISQSKADIQRIISDFETSLQDIMNRAFNLEERPLRSPQLATLDTPAAHRAMPEPNATAVTQGQPISPSEPRSCAAGPASPPTAPILHHGVICDMCDKTVEGVRHKCLDCPDYDLCSACMMSGASQRHNPFHEFFEARDPHNHYVHTIFEGDRTPNCQTLSEVSHTDVMLQAHPASCDLCDSRIYGVRYKCTVCPDFDTCKDCFGITLEQHPGHSFARITNPDDYIRRPSPSSSSSRHPAICNICERAIVGIRYKCMHYGCSDFDLCDVCEAHPIPLHPTNHPMLKLRSADTEIPVVRRAPLAEGTCSRRSSIYEAGFINNPNQPLPDSLDNLALSESNDPFAGDAATREDSLRIASEAKGPCRGSDTSMTLPVRPADILPADLNMPLYTMKEDPALQDSVVTAVPEGASTRLHTSDLPQIVPSQDHSLSPVVEGSTTLQSILDSSGLEMAVHVPLVPKRTPSASVSHDGEIASSPVSWLWTGHELNHLIGEALTITSSHAPVQETKDEGVDLSTDQIALKAVFDKETSFDKSPFQDTSSDVETKRYSLAALLDEYRSATVPETSITCAESTTPNSLTKSASLSADFVADITVHDGQTFPPGAEFVKAWKILNDGDRDWPEGTELIYLAGASFGKDGSTQSIKTGPVQVGEAVTLWVNGLKAPEIPGRYVSYWGLRDDKDEMFGNSIWIDINVAEANENSDESLSSSSMIVMPKSAPAESLLPMPCMRDRAEETAASSPTTEPSQTLGDSNDFSDGDISDASELSFISIPHSDDEDDDAELWEASRTPARTEEANQNAEYVLLYEDNTSSEDE